MIANVKYKAAAIEIPDPASLIECGFEKYVHISQLLSLLVWIQAQYFACSRGQECAKLSQHYAEFGL